MPRWFYPGGQLVFSVSTREATSNFSSFHYLYETLQRLVRKFFPLDKNYLLEAAQLRTQDRLLNILIGKAKAAYQLIHNPLGLNDAFSNRIDHFKATNLRPLHPFYENLAGIYRYKHGETQLTFLWDGREHSEKYEEDWARFFDEWIDQLCQRPQFVQAVLDLSVFLPDNRHAHLAESRMNAVMIDLFELKIHRTKGIVKMKMA